jgi:hypothetical protein
MLWFDWYKLADSVALEHVSILMVHAERTAKDRKILILNLKSEFFKTALRLLSVVATYVKRE